MRGREFKVANELRARDLENEGLAFRIEPKAEQSHLNKMEQPPMNKAADAGPFDSVGGTTGEDSPVPSSPPVRRRGRPRLHPLKED